MSRPPGPGPADGASARGGTVGVVLCGGSSRRMGRDKATIGPPGRPLAARVASALRDAGVGEVLLVGGDGGALRDHADAWVPDDRPGAGPLAATATAARLRPGADLLVCACDLPALTRAALLPLLDALADGAGAAVVAVDGREQWSVFALRGPVAASIGAPGGPVASGVRSLHGALDRVARRLDPAPGTAAAYRDADRPEDLPPELRT